MKISDVKINAMVNPVGFDFKNLRAAWIIEDTAAKTVTFTQIQVSTDPDFKKVEYTKEGEDLDSTGEPLDLELLPRTRYYLRIAAEGDNKEQAVSDTAYFETAKMSEPWKAKWIKPQKEDTFHPLFAKEFETAKDKAISRGRLYISGLGMYTGTINNQPFTKEVLLPYTSDYHTEVQYQTFDVTGLLKENQINSLKVTLGNGWYKGVFGLGHKADNWGSEFMLIAELHVQYEDGTEDVIATDESWKYKGSDIESSGIYDGEVINHLLWEKKENPWKTPVPAEAEGKLVERYSLPVVEMEDMPVKEVIDTPKGEKVLDFGQNFAGYVTFDTFLPKGTKVILDFGEILQDGNFYNANYREAKSQFVYISDGRQELVKPHFTYFGFRYVRVTGWFGEPSKDDFIGKAVYTKLTRTGYLETGHAKVNRLYLNALWGQKSNFVDFPTDCPQRDERLGWSGDAQVFSGTASYNMDTAPFYHKFLHDLRTEQKKWNGIAPGVIPVLDPNGPIYSSVWGDVATIIPTVLFEHTGDKTALREEYPLMKDWVDRITEDDKKRGQQYLYNWGNQLGDWLALDGRTEQSMNGGTDEYYIGSMYYAMSVKMVSDAAGALGKTEESSKYFDLYMKICDAIIHEYFTPSGRLAIDSQTGYIVALYSGIYPDKDKVVEGLRTRLYKDCYKMKGGFVGAPIMCRVMADNGLQEEAFYFLMQNGYPGWMHCVDLGATTIWERWNSVLDDGHLSGTMMNSLNHYSYGAVVEFLYRNVASLRPLEAGFKKVEFSPCMNSKLHYTKASYRSAYGTWKTSWEIKKDGHVHASIEVPFGCTAVVGLPFYPEKEIGEVGAGVHTWDYQPTEDLRSRYSKQTMFKDMMQDEQAMKIIERVSPLLQYFLSTGNEDFLYDSLDTLMGMSFMGFKQEDVEKLTDELLAIYD